MTRIALSNRGNLFHKSPGKRIQRFPVVSSPRRLFVYKSSWFLNCLAAAPLSEQRRNHELGDATRNSKNEVGAEITSCSNPKISSWSCPVIAYCVRAAEWLRVRINLKYTIRNEFVRTKLLPFGNKTHISVLRERHKKTGSTCDESVKRIPNAFNEVLRCIGW